MTHYMFLTKQGVVKMFTDIFPMGKGYIEIKGIGQKFKKIENV